MPNKGFDARKFVKGIQNDINKEAKRQKLSVPVQTDVRHPNATAFNAPYFAQHPMSIERNVEAPAKGKKYDLFISHANSDKNTYVQGLYDALSKLGISIFYDIDSIGWGDKWKDKILEGTASSEFAIIVISNSFFGREWTEIELNEFLQRQNDSGQKTILPLLFGVSQEQLGEKYPDLADIQCLDTTGLSFDSIAILFAKELIKRLRG
jgi:hypothetical protein